jgi:hypothetical protein
MATRSLSLANGDGRVALGFEFVPQRDLDAAAVRKSSWIAGHFMTSKFVGLKRVGTSLLATDQVEIDRYLLAAGFHRQKQRFRGRCMKLSTYWLFQIDTDQRDSLAGEFGRFLRCPLRRGC